MLDLSMTDIRRDGLGCLTGLPRLEWLDFSHPEMSDAGITHLWGLPRLRTNPPYSTAVVCAECSLDYAGHLTGKS